MEETKRIYLTIDDLTGVFAISCVDEPATEQLIEYFNEVKVMKFKKLDEEKRLIAGVIMRPEIWIDRKNEKTNEYYQVAFSKDTIEKICQKYMIDKNNNNVTIQHEYSVNNISLVETWIVDNPELDKSKSLGISTINGDWFGIMKVNNDVVWNDFIKTGLVKGYSVEGMFIQEQFSKILTDDEKLLEKLKDLLSKVD